MYHALLQEPAAGLSRVHIEANTFAQQMAWLHAEGYEGLTVADWYDRRARQQLPRRCVVLTFDDGYLSLLQVATPILTKYGFAATLFLTTDFVDQPDYSTTAFAGTAPPDDRPLTWAEVQVLRDAGWDIQAHSRTHRAHAGLTVAELQVELRGSKQLIEQRLDALVRFYAFPYGSYSWPALQAQQEAGYWAGFSVHGGQADAASDLRRLPRTEMNTSCDLALFARLVCTGYPSTGAKYRAKLRNILFHYPAVKDAVQKVLPGFVN